MKSVYISYILLAVSALWSCDTEIEPTVPGNEGTEEEVFGSGDGSFIFKFTPDSYFDVDPDRARSAISRGGNHAVDVVDSTSEAFVKVTPVPPCDPGSRNATVGDMDLFNRKWSGGLNVAAWLDGHGEHQFIFTGSFSKSDNTWAAPNTETTYYWPTAGTVTIAAWTPVRFGLSPKWFNGSNVSDSPWGVNAADHNEYHANDLKLYYYTPDWANRQDDLMVGKYVQSDASQVNKGSEGKNIQMKHVLAAVRFRFATRPGWGPRFDSNTWRSLYGLEVNFKKRSGYYNIATESWEVEGDTDDFWAITSNDQEYVGSWIDPVEAINETDAGKGSWQNFLNFPWEDHEYNDFLSNTQTFMVIPQNLNGAKVKFIYKLRNDDNTRYEYIVTLPDIQLEAGKITYIDIQEPSVFVEGYENGRKMEDNNGNIGDHSWPLPKWNNGSGDTQEYHYLRLYEDGNGNYYQTRTGLWWPENPVPVSEEQAWNNNDRRYYGFRTRFNVLSRTHNNDHPNVFYSSEDPRWNFFVVKDETFNYTERHWNQHREAIMYDLRNQYTNGKTGQAYQDALDKATSPAAWNTSDILGNDSRGSGWEMLGGVLNVRLMPTRRSTTDYPHYNKTFKNTGRVHFWVDNDPSRSEIRFPERIPVGGSVQGLPTLYIQPLKNHSPISRTQQGYKPEIVGGKKQWGNLRSYRSCYLLHRGEGRYTNPTAAELGSTYASDQGIRVMQFAPYDPNAGNRGEHWFLSGSTNWVGFGSVIMYASTMHGSYGHKDEWPWEEFESRLGIQGGANGRVQNPGMFWNDPWNGWSDIINDYSRSFTSGYIFVPVGVYDIEYNMANKTIQFHRHASVFSWWEYEINNNYHNRLWGNSSQGFYWYAYPYDYIHYPGWNPTDPSYKSSDGNPAWRSGVGSGVSNYYWDYESNGRWPDQTTF